MHQKKIYGIAVGVARFAALLVLWINLAVGIIGEPDDLANLMYLGVFAVGAVGALATRFRPRGMASSLFAMVLAQALVAMVTWFTGLGYPPTPPLSLLILNVLLIMFWAGSAVLFLKASRA